MTCEHCGAPLAPIAQFCGRCGRSVGVIAPPPVFPGAGVLPEDPVEAPSEVSEGADPAPADLLPCVVCGTRPEPADRFCGECGEALGSPVPPSSAFDVPEASDRFTSPGGDVAPESVWESVPEPVSAAVPDPVPAAASMATPERRPVVLQFSTGESVSVLGSGLLGRNPRPEPGEVVDHVVIVTDPTRSVSKTHLEFGFDDDAFWVSDRHSGNGTVLREPGQLPRFCEPGRRYHVARGTRVDMGDQFVIIG